MFIYFLVIISSIIFAFLAEHNKNNVGKKILYCFSFLLLFIFSAIRYKVGFDYEYRYLPIYEAISIGKVINIEILFKLINIIAYKIFNNADFVFIVSSFITVYLVFYVILKKSPNIVLSIFLFIGTRMYFYSFTQIRQYIAIAIFLFAINYIEKRKLLKYVFCILIAACFHKIALIYLPIYFINRINLKKKTYYFITIIAFLFEEVVYYVYSVIAPLLYGRYFNTGYGIGNDSIAMTLIAIFTMIFTVLYYSQIQKMKFGNIYLNLQLIFWILSTTTHRVNESYRIVALFMYSSIILLPMIHKCMKYKYNKRAFIFCNIIFFSVSIIMYLSSDSSMIPYRTIFNK